METEQGKKANLSILRDFNPLLKTKDAKRRLTVLLSVFCLLVIISSLILYPVNRAIIRTIEELKNDFISRAEEYTGYKLEYTSLGPSIFNTLDLRNFSMTREDGSVFIFVSRLELSYSIAALLKNKNLEAFRSARFERPRINLDAEKDAALLKLFGGEENSTENLPFDEIFPVDFDIRLRSGEWAFLNRNFSLDLKNMNFDASIHRGNINFNGRWNAGGIVYLPDSPFLGRSEIETLMTGRINGEFNGKNGRANITIPSLAGDFVVLKPLSFSIVLDNGLLDVQKIYDKSPSSISLHMDIDNSKLIAFFSGENFSLKDIFSFSGPLEAHNVWLDSGLSGSAVFEKNGDDASRYSIYFSGRIPAETPLGNGNFILIADGDSSGIEFHEFKLSVAAGNFSYYGGLDFFPLSPNGLMSISEFGFYGNPEERISFDLQIESDESEMSVFADNLAAGNTNIRNLSLTVYRDDHGFSFDFSALSGGDSKTEAEKNQSNIFMGGSFEYDPVNIWADINIDSLSAREVAGLARPFIKTGFLSGPVSGFLDGISVSTEVFFNTDYRHVLFNAPLLSVFRKDTGEILAEASVSGTGDRFELRNAYINIAGKPAAFNVLTAYSNPNDINFEAMFSYDDISYYFDGSYLDGNSIIINGSYGLQAFFSSSGRGSWSGFAQADYFPIPDARSDLTTQLSFLTSFRFDSPEFWSASMDYFSVERFSSTGTVSVFRFSGDADQEGLLVNNLYFMDGRGSLSGNLNLLWNDSYSNFYLTALMHDLRQEERYDLKAVYEDSKFSLDFSGDKMQIGRIAGSNNTVASGYIKADWESMDLFRAESEISSLNLRMNGGDAMISAKAVLDQEEFMLYDLNVEWNEIKANAQFIRIDRPLGVAAAKAEINGNLEGKKIDIDLQGRAEFKAFDNWFGIRNAIDSFEGMLILERAVYGIYEAQEPFNFVLSNQKNENGSRLYFGGGPRNMVRFHYAAAENSEGGNFFAALSSPFPIRGSFTGYIDSKTIDAQTSDLYIDLFSLWNLYPFMKSVALPGGIINADLRVFGPLREPDFFGIARTSSLKVQIPGFIPDDIRPVPAPILFNGNEMSFGPVEASIGNGNAVVSAWFNFDGWIPNSYDMDINVPANSPIPFNYTGAGVIASGFASGKMNISHEDNIMQVTGDLTAQNAEISLNDDVSSGDDGGMSGDETASVVNLVLRTGRRVEFFWPSFEFPVIQTYADLGSSVHILSDTSDRHYTLTGNVRLRGGEIYYLDRNFYIREGTLFFRESEIEFNPRITARAEIRDQGPEGPVTVSMVIDNALLRSFEPRFESSPPLSQYEIYSILGQNLMDDPERSRDILITSSVDIFTNFTIFRRLQRGARNALGLDMFSVRTQVLQNVFFQLPGINTFVESTTNSQNLSAWNRVGTYFDKTTLFLGKYIGSDIFAQALLSFRYDEERNTPGGMYFEPEIGIEMRNPLFDIQFNMIPQNPESWFLDGASFTLSWRRTF